MAKTPLSNQGERLVCAKCVKDSYLGKVISEKGKTLCCSCGQGQSKTITFQELSTYIEELFKNHLSIVDPDSKSNFKNDVSTQNSVVEIIRDQARVDDSLAVELQEFLEKKFSSKCKEDEENIFSKNTQYNYKENINYLSERSDKIWDKLKVTIKEENRIFNKRAGKIFRKMIGNIPTSSSENEDSAIVYIGPEDNNKNLEASELFRARVFKSEKDALKALRKPDLELGPPPSTMASAGRMNSMGISVFYGAIEPDTANAEVRPPVGSFVVITRFKIKRSLRILNINALKSVLPEPSMFDPNYIKARKRQKFINSLVAHMNTPVVPEDETFEYLITQAFADYLSGKTKPRIHGVMFRSVQYHDANGKSGRNIMLFHKYSRVMERDKSKKIKIDIFRDSEDNIQYQITESASKKNRKKKNKNTDRRKPILELE